MCPRFESRWYHSLRQCAGAAFFLTFAKIKSVHQLERQLAALISDLEMDCVAWVREKNLDARLIDCYREQILCHCSAPLVELDVDGGEKLKQWAALEETLQQFEEWGITRSSLVLTTGGGALSDAFGLAASIWKRGCRVIHMPTTSLAAIDAAWGGKTALNWHGAKNQIGTFHQPVHVHLDARWMHTLDSRNFRAGLAEAAKHALLDTAAFKLFQESTPTWPMRSEEDEDQWTSWLRNSARVKQSIVAADEFEKGERVTLNLGHTVAHALEAFAHEKNVDLLHGEAVAVGLHFAFFEASEGALADALVNPSQFEPIAWITQWLNDHIPTPNFTLPSSDAMWHWMTHDKKNQRDEVRDVAWRGVGNVVWPVSWQKETFEATWNRFSRL